MRPAEGKFFVSIFQFPNFSKMSFWLIFSDRLQVKVLEQQLEQEHEERISFLRERHELEGKIMGLQVILMPRTFLWDVFSDAGPDFRTCLTEAGTKSRLRS